MSVTKSRARRGYAHRVADLTSYLLAKYAGTGNPDSQVAAHTASGTSGVAEQAVAFTSTAVVHAHDLEGVAQAGRLGAASLIS